MGQCLREQLIGPASEKAPTTLNANLRSPSTPQNFYKHQILFETVRNPNFSGNGRLARQELPMGKRGPRTGTIHCSERRGCSHWEHELLERFTDYDGEELKSHARFS